MTEPAQAPPPKTRDREGTSHILKTRQLYFQAIAAGAKRFELRNEADRELPFLEGQIVRLDEVDVDGVYTGNWITARIVYVLRGPFGMSDTRPGLASGWVVFSFDVLEKRVP